jgi:anti-anti-sigma factor
VTCCAVPDPHRLAFAGEVDIALEESLAAIFSFLTHSRPSDVAICLHDVTFLDSTGLDFLVQVQEEVRRAGRSLRLVAPSVAVRWVLRIAGLIAMFAVEEATPAAVAACECRSPRIDGIRILVPGQRMVGMEGATG